MSWANTAPAMEYGTMLVVVVLSLRMAWRRFLGTRCQQSAAERWVTTGAHAAAILLVASATAFAVNLLSETGFLHQGRTMAAVEQAHFGDVVPRITRGEVIRLLKEGAVSVDARLTPDYEAGHVPGAISVPVSASPGERQRDMAGVPKDASIVLYCQSSSCPFAERVGKGLQDNGYTHLVVFADGWEGWSAASSAAQEKGARSAPQRGAP